MPDDSVRLNITPGHVVPSVARVEPTAAVAEVHAISADDTPNLADRPLHDPGPLQPRKQPAVVDGTVDQLEARIILVNKLLQRNGTAISLGLTVEDDGSIHLEIADHRVKDEPVVKRLRIIEHDEITRLINDLLGEVGICLDETA